MRIDRISVTIRPCGWIRGTMDLELTVRVGGQEITDRKLVPEFDLVSRFDQYMQIVTEEIREHFLRGPDEDEPPALRTEPPTTPSV